MSVFAASTFDAADGTPLAGYGGWAVHPTSTSDRMEIRSGQAKLSSGSDVQLYYMDTVAPSADCEVFADICMATGTGGYYGVCARLDAVAGTYYYARYSSGSVQLYKSVAGTLTQLGSNYGAGSVTTGGTHRIGLRVEGDSIKALWNGAEVISRTDGDIAAAGYTGFRGATVSLRLDNFSASTLGAGVSAAIAAVEAGDTVAIAGAAVPVPVLAALAVVEAGDVAAATGVSAGDGGAVRRLVLPLDLERGGAAANKTGLRYRIFSAGGAVVQQGMVTTDASGLLAIDLTAPFVAGDWAEVLIQEYDDGVAPADRTIRAFSGFALVTSI